VKGGSAAWQEAGFPQEAGIPTEAGR
jgi:hypothetical protein